MASLDLRELGEGCAAQVEVVLPGVAPALVRAEVGYGNHHVCVEAEGGVDALNLQQDEADSLLVILMVALVGLRRWGY